MKTLVLVARKEINHGLNSLFAYLLIALFAASFSIPAFWAQGNANVFLTGLADMRSLMSMFPLFLMVLVPAMTMRTWTGEKASGTHELLSTWPISDRDLVLGKFLGSYLLVGLALLATLPVPVLVSRLGDLDWGPVIGAFCGAYLLAACCLAICLFLSSFSRDPVSAFLLGLTTLAIAMFLPWEQVNFHQRFNNISRGVLDIRDLLFYFILTLLFLVLSVSQASSKRRFY